MKKTIVLLFMIAAVVACNQTDNEKKKNDAQSEITQVSIHELLASPEDFVDKKVAIEGTIDHVCRHGGKKMFMIGDDPEDRIKITPDNVLGTFEVELEGSTYWVEGILQELVVNDSYIAMLEAEEAKVSEGEESHDDNPMHMGLHDEEEAEAEAVPASKQLREQLEASGKDQLSFYSIEANTLKEAEAATAEDKK